MIQIKQTLTPNSLLPKIEKLFSLSAEKIHSIEKKWDSSRGTPVFTVQGQYTTRGWTEWTQGFQFGSEVLQFDATGDKKHLESGRKHTEKYMATHVSHVGVHDHGFNNVSTYGNLLRLALEGKFKAEAWEVQFYQLALKLSGAVQASRWTDLPGNLGYIRSFNGPHSLFCDTIRSLRALAMSHKLGHVLMGERDTRNNLLERVLQHAETSAQYNVFFGRGRDSYDVRGRVAHEAVFNLTDGSFRCPSTQQGYSPFSTWTRGLAWILAGYPEQLEFLSTLPESEFTPLLVGTLKGKQSFLDRFLEVSLAVADFYLENTPVDGVPYWDTGAPGLARMGDYLNRPAEPFNVHEPVDSSAAAISAQGLLRLGKYLIEIGRQEQGEKYFQAALTIADTIFSEPYLSIDPKHQGLILHSVYHRPNGWDYVPSGQHVPCGESSLWGDYHARELALCIQRIAKKESYFTFYGNI